MSLYTVDALITNAKLRAFLPTSNTSATSLTDSDILLLANDELWGSVTPKIQKAVQEYFVQEFPFQLVPGQDVYDLPYRATGGALRDVYLLPTSDYYQRQRLARVSPETIQGYAPTSTQTNNSPTSFWVQGNQILLYPHVTNSFTLILSCFFRPNIMTQLAPTQYSPTCDTITAVNYLTGVVTVSGNGAANAWTVGSNYDIIRANPGFDTLGFDYPALAVTGPTSITFSTAALTAIENRLAIGDYVCPAQYACVPQIPQTLHPLLAARTALRIDRAIGDTGNAAGLAQDVADMEETMYQMLVNRVEGKQDTLPPNDLIGWTRPRYWTGPF